MRLDYPFTIETSRIFEITEPSEYLALSVNNRHAYDVIMSLGNVDLNEGTLVQTLLWNMFGENTATGGKLRDPDNGLVYVPREENGLGG